MSHGNAYIHLFESAKENDMTSITETRDHGCITHGRAPDEMNDEGACPDCHCDNAGHWRAGFCTNLCRPRLTPEPPTSPWVKRNESYSQYPQPRGSQYEG